MLEGKPLVSVYAFITRSPGEVECVLLPHLEKIPVPSGQASCVGGVLLGRRSPGKPFPELLFLQP